MTFHALHITLLEDLHSGTGTGRGSEADAVQIVDRRGNPVLRATHIRGVLREKALEIVRYSKPRFSDADVQALFGESSSGKRGALLLLSARLLPDLSEDRTSETWSRLWGSTARRLGDRCPEDDTLRFVEYVAAGRTFQGTVVLRDGDSRLFELLRLAIRRMDCLGARRNRGFGRIATRVEPVSPTSGTLAAPMPGQTRLRLFLRNLDPVGLPSSGNPGNLIPTECFLRGQVLRGAFARWGLDVGLSPAELGETVLSPRISFLDGFPLPHGSEARLPVADLDAIEVLPMPLLYGSEKPGRVSPATQEATHNEAPCLDVPWWAQERECVADRKFRLEDRLERKRVKAAQERKLKRPGDRELLQRVMKDATWTPWRRFSPTVNAHLRNGVPAGQRGAGGKLELFAEEELAEDTLFLVELECREGTEGKFFTQFERLLHGEDWLRLGRGGRPAVMESPQWLQDRQCVPEIAPNEITFVLTSDCIARTADLTFYEELDPAVLGELAGLSPAVDLGQLEWWSECDAVEIRGFNAASGLPRVPSLAIRRGSCLRIAARAGGRNELDRLFDALSSRRRTGLGERLEDGFGRFRLDFGAGPLEVEVAITAPEKSLSIKESESLLRVSIDAAQQIGKLELSPSASQWMDFLNALEPAAECKAVLDAYAALGKQLGARGWKETVPKLRSCLKVVTGERAKKAVVRGIVEHLLLQKREKGAQR